MNNLNAEDNERIKKILNEIYTAIEKLAVSAEKDAYSPGAYNPVAEARASAYKNAMTIVATAKYSNKIYEPVRYEES